MRALITGITGQDGSYLSELLLEKGYEVHGLVRRAAVEDPADRADRAGRIHHIANDLVLHGGDLQVYASVFDVVRNVMPDECYHLGAQSFVKESFDSPFDTFQTNAVGTLHLLEALRHLAPQCRFYFAGTSEMFGNASTDTPQSEETPLDPQSPYAISKVAGFQFTSMYRKAYNLFACSGILFNHECIAETTPLIVQKDGVVNVSTGSELVSLRRKGPSVQHFEVPGLSVWDGKQWSSVLGITATRRRTTNEKHRLLTIQARAGVIDVTTHHRMLNARAEPYPARDVNQGDHLALAAALPKSPGQVIITSEMAEFLGLMTADGDISERHIRFTNNDPTIRARVAELWHRLFLGEASEWFGVSGWNPDKEVGKLTLTRCNVLCDWLQDQLYARNGYKRVPRMVLNAPPKRQLDYLRGYYTGDGLKAGNGTSTKTNSPLLAQGIYWLYANQGRLSSVYVEQRGHRTYFQLNIPSDCTPGQKGQHLRKEPAEVRKVEDAVLSSEWVFDLETESGVFCAGVGRLVVHNSPRRGVEFVTRKITRGVAAISLGRAEKLHLGNLDAKRDWGFAGDYVKAMWLMLQQEKPDDYVVGSGKAYSVRDFVKAAFGAVNLDYEKHIVIDPEFFRPAEVHVLHANPTKARKVLQWRPNVSFEDLVVMMVEHDVSKYVGEKGEQLR